MSQSEKRTVELASRLNPEMGRRILDEQAHLPRDQVKGEDIGLHVLAAIEAGTIANFRPVLVPTLDPNEPVIKGLLSTLGARTVEEIPRLPQMYSNGIGVAVEVIGDVGALTELEQKIYPSPTLPLARVAFVATEII